jgi:hypothetical protein
VLVAREAAHVDAVDAREVHAAHLEELAAQIELGRVAGLAALLALGRIAIVGMKALQLRIGLGVALAELGVRLGGAIRRQGAMFVHGPTPC